MMRDKGADPQRERVIDQKSEVTGRISDTCRVIGFGLLVFYFTVHFNDSEAAVRLREKNNWSLFIIGAFGALTIFMDYLQYLFGSRAAKAALKNEAHLYDDKSFDYRARNFFFTAKQATAGLGSLVLIYVIATSAGFTSVTEGTTPVESVVCLSARINHESDSLCYQIDTDEILN